MVGEHRQIGYPRADFVSVLFGHDAHGLCNVSKVVDHPGRQQLAKGHRAERWMLAWQIQFVCRQPPGAQRAEVVGAQSGELVEQRLKRSIDVARSMSESIVWLEPDAVPARQNDARARHPVRLLTVDQMSNDIKRAERIRSLVAANPRVG